MCLQDSQVLYILQVWSTCGLTRSAIQEGQENDPKHFPSHFCVVSIWAVRAAKEAATVNTTPNGLVRKGEVVGKGQSVVAVKMHPRLNSSQTWCVFTIFLQVAKIFFLFLRQHAHSSEWFFVLLPRFSAHSCITAQFFCLAWWCDGEGRCGGQTSRRLWPDSVAAVAVSGKQREGSQRSHWWSQF